MSSFYTEEELAGIGFASVGHHVLISRKASIYHPERISIGSHVRIDDFCVISACREGFVNIGSHCFMGAMCFVEATSGFIMESFSSFAARVTVFGGTDDYTGASLTNPCVPEEFRRITTGLVRICRHTIVGTSSVIMSGVTIGEGAALGACSLVMKDLRPGGIYAGVPARLIRARKEDMFELEKLVAD